MATVLIVYYSRTGNTEAMARAVTEGAIFEGVEVVLKRVDSANEFDVSFADAVAFGSPCHFAYMAGALKAFFDTKLKIHGADAQDTSGGFRVRRRN
jgi:NAD(P)H dehydrogenase (quinone)